MERGCVCWASEGEALKGLEGEGGSGSQGRGRSLRKQAACVEVVVWVDDLEDWEWQFLELVEDVALGHLGYLWLRACCVAVVVWSCSC